MHRHEIESIEFNARLYTVQFDASGNITQVWDFGTEGMNDFVGKEIVPPQDLRDYLQGVIDEYIYAANHREGEDEYD